MILRLIDEDPHFFLRMLAESRSVISGEAYDRYYEAAAGLFEKSQDLYLRKSIEASYICYENMPELNGNSKLSLDKVVEMIQYFASSEYVIHLHKAKLMGLMWCADALAHKLLGRSITGLVYQADAAGAVPVSHNMIISLAGVPYENDYNSEYDTCYFSLKKAGDYFSVSKEELKILEYTAQTWGGMSRSEITAMLYQDAIDKEKLLDTIISFEYADTLKMLDPIA